MSSMLINGNKFNAEENDKNIINSSYHNSSLPHYQNKLNSELKEYYNNGSNGDISANYNNKHFILNANHMNDTDTAISHSEIMATNGNGGGGGVGEHTSNGYFNGNATTINVDHVDQLERNEMLNGDGDCSGGDSIYGTIRPHTKKKPNDEFNYKTLNGSVIRSVHPPGKGNANRYKVSYFWLIVFLFCFILLKNVSSSFVLFVKRNCLFNDYFMLFR